MNENVQKVLDSIADLNLKSKPIVPSEMTLDDIARLRFIGVSPEDAEAIELELQKRGLVPEDFTKKGRYNG